MHGHSASLKKMSTINPRVVHFRTHLDKPKSDILSIALLSGQESRIFCNIQDFNQFEKWRFNLISKHYTQGNEIKKWFQSLDLRFQVPVDDMVPAEHLQTSSCQQQGAISFSFTSHLVLPQACVCEIEIWRAIGNGWWINQFTDLSHEISGHALLHPAAPLDVARQVSSLAQFHDEVEAALGLRQNEHQSDWQEKTDGVY
jgi:hypothetical protein